MQTSFLPARRRASAGTSYGLVSVRPIDTSRSSIETAERIELIFGTDASFGLHPTLCYKEIRVSPKTRVGLLLAGTLPQTRDFKIFRHYKSGPLYLS